MPATKTDRKRIALTMAGFDFIRVQKTMKQMKWKWAIRSSPSFRIPTTQDLKDTAHRLLMDTCEKESDGYSTTAASGGFIAQKEDGHFSLLFVIEESHSCDYTPITVREDHIQLERI